MYLHPDRPGDPWKETPSWTSNFRSVSIVLRLQQEAPLGPLLLPPPDVLDRSTEILDLMRKL